MEKDITISLLMDFYGSLLTKKQLEAMELYYNDDFSLAEVAQNMSITRQGARDLITRGAQALRECEAELGLFERFRRLSQGLEEIIGKAEVIAGSADKADIRVSAENIITIASELLQDSAGG